MPSHRPPAEGVATAKPKYRLTVKRSSYATTTEHHVMQQVLDEIRAHVKDKARVDLTIERLS